MAYVINKDCIACGACEVECPTECITMTGENCYGNHDHKAMVDGNRCIECGACYNVCPVDAPNPE